jgi:hypothetical protein
MRQAVLTINNNSQPSYSTSRISEYQKKGKRPSISSVEKGKLSTIFLSSYGTVLAPSPFFSNKSFKYTLNYLPLPTSNSPVPTEYALL